MTESNTESLSLLSLAVDEFLSRAGAREPTPGGGAVAALTAALAVSMARMVAAYSSNPETPADHRTQLTELAGQLKRLDQICRRCVDEDAAAYHAYRAASRGVRRDKESVRTLQSAVRLAVSVPLEVGAMSVSLLRLLEQHKAIMKQTLHSDLAVAAHLAVAACRSARETASINIFELDSQDDRTRLYRQSDHYVEVGEMLADQIVSFVRS